MFPDDDEFEFVGPDRGWNYEPSRAELFKQFKSPVYTTDADGWLTYYNDAAAELWGYRPELGKTRWCGSWRIFTTDGARCRSTSARWLSRSRKSGRCAVFRLCWNSQMARVSRSCPTPHRCAMRLALWSRRPTPAQDHEAGRFRSNRSSNQTDGPADARQEEADLELDDLTGSLQATLASRADVEFEYQIDCERLEDWSGPR